MLVPPAKPKTPNETSLVIVGYDRVKNTAFLFTGDIPAGMIRQILPKLPNHVNVLQAPHHGSDAGILELVAKTNPDYVVISANKGNRYQHPKLPILRQLARIRPPPNRVQQLFANVYGGGHDRFNALTLAKEVRARVERGMKDLRQPNSMGRMPSYADLIWQSNRIAEGFASRTNPPGNPLPNLTFTGGYEQVLITGERGHLQFVDGHYSGRSDPEAALFMDLIWGELADVTDNELRQLRNWEEAQAYLSLVAAGRQNSLFRPAKIRFDGAPQEAAQTIDRARVLALGRARVSAARWGQLSEIYAAQSEAEREAALVGVRDALARSSDLDASFPSTKSVLSSSEASALIAAAVADYETGSGDKHLNQMTSRINQARQTAWNNAVAQESAKKRARTEAARPKTERGWLAPALRQLGASERFASFSGPLLEAALMSRIRLH